MMPPFLEREPCKDDKVVAKSYLEKMPDKERFWWETMNREKMCAIRKKLIESPYVLDSVKKKLLDLPL